MNQLEKWSQNDVIHLYMSEPANIEAKRGGPAQRHQKVAQFGPTMLTLATTLEDRALLRQKPMFYLLDFLKMRMSGGTLK